MRYGDFHHDGGSSWIHLLGWLLPFLFIGALVALVVVLLTRGDHRTGLRAATVDDGAHAALRLRYARGDITRDEYYEAMRDLSHPAGAWTPPPAASPATPPAPPAAPPAPRPDASPDAPPDAPPEA